MLRKTLVIPALAVIVIAAAVVSFADQKAESRTAGANVVLLASDESRGTCKYKCEKEENECILKCGPGPSKENPQWQECRSLCRDTATACRDACRGD